MIQKEIDGQIFYVYGQLQMASSKKETLCWKQVIRLQVMGQSHKFLEHTPPLLVHAKGNNNQILNAMMAK